MAPLSKSIQLGVIILALGWLRELNLSLPRVILPAALALGVSRKSGYLAARRILALLGESNAGTEGERERDLKREITVLRIKNQLLVYERDHPGVRFADRRRHLKPNARSLCVRLLRDFRGELREAEIASLLGVPLSSLRRWDRNADRGCGFAERPERRGIHSRATPLDVERVTAEYKSLTAPLSLEEFADRFRQKYPDRPLDRRTLTKILQGEGLRKAKTKDTSKPYRDSVTVYFPGAQAAVDATECQVRFLSGAPETVTVKEEVAIDIATCAILGDALGVEETAEGVKHVLVRAREECRSLLAVLSDNGSANRAAAVGEELEEAGVDQVFTFPYHPQTDGHIEGLFGQFSRIAGRIEIDDSSRVAIARSIVAIIFRIFVYFHNHSPRERLGGMSPLEYLRSYNPSAAELRAARAGLKQRKQRSQRLREKHPRFADPGFGELLRGILERHRFEIPLEKAISALLSYDTQVIQSASNALFAQSQRDSFDERKRTFAYFVGIVRRKQKDLDDGRLQAELARQGARRRREEYDASARARQREAKEEQEELRTCPERVVLRYADLLLRGGLRLMRGTWLGRVREGLLALDRLGRLSANLLADLSTTIRSWGRFRENLKEELIQILRAEFDVLADRRVDPPP